MAQARAEGRAAKPFSREQTEYACGGVTPALFSFVMAYIILQETFNALLIFIALLFCAGILCEWMNTEKKHIYQFLIFFTTALLSGVLGFELFTENIMTANGVTMQFGPLGFIMIFFGFSSFVILAINISQIIKKPIQRL